MLTPRYDRTLTIFTIGHSTLPIEKFLETLDAHGMRQLVDVFVLEPSTFPIATLGNRKNRQDKHRCFP